MGDVSLLAAVAADLQVLRREVGTFRAAVARLRELEVKDPPVPEESDRRAEATSEQVLSFLLWVPDKKINTHTAAKAAVHPHRRPPPPPGAGHL